MGSDSESKIIMLEVEIDAVNTKIHAVLRDFIVETESVTIDTVKVFAY